MIPLGRRWGKVEGNGVFGISINPGLSGGTRIRRGQTGVELNVRRKSIVRNWGAIGDLNGTMKSFNVSARQ